MSGKGKNSREALSDLSLENSTARGVRRLILELVEVLPQVTGGPTGMILKSLWGGILPEVPGFLEQIDRDPELQDQVDTLIRRLIDAYGPESEAN